VINPKPLLLLNHFTFPVFLPAAGAVSSAIAATGQKKTFTEGPPRSTQFFGLHKTQLNPFVTTTVLSLRVSRNHNSVWESGTTPCGGQASQKKETQSLQRAEEEEAGKQESRKSLVLARCAYVRAGEEEEGRTACGYARDNNGPDARFVLIERTSTQPTLGLGHRRCRQRRGQARPRHDGACRITADSAVLQCRITVPNYGPEYVRQCRITNHNRLSRDHVNETM